MMDTTISPSRVAAVLLLLLLGSSETCLLRADTAAEPDSSLATAEVGQAFVAADDLSQIAAEQKLADGEYLSSPYDDAWLISTRHMGCLSGKEDSTSDLDISRYDNAGEWVTSDLHQLLASEPRLTIIYVHGNRVSHSDAITRGWNAFRVLQADPAAPPMRLVIWSWPSDKIHGQVRDVRAKAARTNTEGQYLGRFLSELDPDTPVSMIGYSYGGRVVTGALHVLGGGTLAGQAAPLHTAPAGRSPINVVLMAAAVHNYWLASGGYHEQMWNYADRLLVLYNSCDPVLRRYRFIEKRARPAALGYTGAWGLDEQLAARTEQRDVCCSVGKTHTEAVFFSSTDVVDRLRQHVLGAGN